MTASFRYRDANVFQRRGIGGQFVIPCWHPIHSHEIRDYVGVLLGRETARLVLRHAVTNKSVEIRERPLVPDCLEGRARVRLGGVTALAATRINVFATCRLLRRIDPTLRRHRIRTWTRARLRRSVARPKKHAGADD